MRVQLLLGDCVNRMREIPTNSVDVVCDPPYNLTPTGSSNPGRRYWAMFNDSGRTDPIPEGRVRRARREGVVPKGFMGMPWDGSDVALSPDFWGQVLRVLRPRGVVKAFGGTRVFHRLAAAMEQAGFTDIRIDAWAYGSGFPKSHNLSKALDRARGDKIEHVCAFLREAIEQSSLSRRDLGNHFGLNPRQVDQWAPRPTDNSSIKRAHVPTWAQWAQLRELLGFSDEMDQEVWRLNARKGQPGEAYLRREVVGFQEGSAATGDIYGDFGKGFDITTGATNDSQLWDGWGTALKPGWEPVVIGRKPGGSDVSSLRVERG